MRFVKGKCPQCGKATHLPSCPNCGNYSLSAEKVMGLFLLACRKCEKDYAHISCPSCSCDIPARAFAGPSWLALALGVVVVIMLLNWLLSRCC